MDIHIYTYNVFSSIYIYTERENVKSIYKWISYINQGIGDFFLVNNYKFLDFNKQFDKRKSSWKSHFTSSSENNTINFTLFITINFFITVTIIIFYTISFTLCSFFF